MTICIWIGGNFKGGNLQVTCAICETIPDMEHELIFHLMEPVFTAVFTCEISMRWWISDSVSAPISPHLVISELKNTAGNNEQTTDDFLEFLQRFLIMTPF